MTILEMLGQGGLLTILGMCVVFSFIIILICCMHLLQKVVHSLGLDKDTIKPAAPAAPPPQPQVDMGAIVAAISTAIKQKE